MKRALAALALALVLGGPALAAPPSERTFAAPVDRVWSTTEAVLKHLGWDIDKSDRSHRLHHDRLAPRRRRELRGVRERPRGTGCSCT